MNQEYIRIQNLIQDAESRASQNNQCLYRLGFHLMPPTGWLNDPNGLCQLGDTYHIFFQYSPLHVNGGMKVWGHYTTKDFHTFQYCGVPFVPDCDFDKDGVFSGSTYVDEDGMHIFYTGNVELPGDYDYVSSGRYADTIRIDSKDGVHFSDKSVVIHTDEYPEHYSCHIRDPKVWRENDCYYMILGGRTRKDEGRILVYTSNDLQSWTMCKEFLTSETFAYMWECPDLFCLNHKYVLSFSPQGIEREEYHFQNIYHAGYFVAETNPLIENVIYDKNQFIEWDMGFDFYAPQSFLDSSGRRILIGWVGVPYAEYSNGEVKENWQHCLTVPRELSVRISKQTNMSVVYQYPIAEITSLRKGKPIAFNNQVLCTDEEYLDVICNDLPKEFTITIAHGVKLIYAGKELILSLTDELGRGRNVRKCLIDKVNNLRILVDSSVLEYYVNDGEVVLTTRYYKKEKGNRFEFDCGSGTIEVYPMNSIVIH